MLQQGEKIERERERLALISAELASVTSAYILWSKAGSPVQSSGKAGWEFSFYSEQSYSQLKLCEGREVFIAADHGIGH